MSKRMEHANYYFRKELKGLSKQNLTVEASRHGSEVAEILDSFFGMLRTTETHPNWTVELASEASAE